MVLPMAMTRATSRRSGNTSRSDRWQREKASDMELHSEQPTIGGRLGPRAATGPVRVERRRRSGQEAIAVRLVTGHLLRSAIVVISLCWGARWGIWQAPVAHSAEEHLIGTPTPRDGGGGVADQPDAEATTNAGDEVPTTLLDEADQRPWQTDRHVPRLLARPIDGPRQLLRLLDIGPSDFDMFIDGREIGPDDFGTFVKILYRLPQIGLDEIHRWQHAAVPWQALTEDPASYRGEFFRLAGRVRRLETRMLPRETAELSEFSHYYEVWMETSPDRRPVVLMSRSVPEAWLNREELDQPAAAAGLFMKLGPPRNGVACGWFATPRVAWLPDREDAAWGVSEDWVRLAGWGLDVGLFDVARHRNRLPMGAEERDAFYSLLDAVGRADPAEVQSLARPLDLARLLQEPQNEQGRLLRAEGTVRRVTKVLVTEPDITGRFDLNHYYQLDVLVALGDQVVEVRGEDGKTAGPVYRNAFPFTYCVRRIPAAWEAWVGRSDMNEGVVIDGWFYRLWSYRNPFVASFDERQRQLSPMFVAIEPAVSAVSAARPSQWGAMVAVIFLGLMAVAWCVVWWVHRSDRRYAEQVLRKRFRPESTEGVGSWTDSS